MKPTSFDRELNYLSIDIGDDVIMTHHDSFQKNFTGFSKQKKIMKNHEFSKIFLQIWNQLGNTYKPVYISYKL